MLYRNENREWAICPFKVRFTQGEEEFFQYDFDKNWWLEFEKKWKDTRIVEFINIVPTEDQLKRLEQIKGIPDGFGEICSNYVENGTFPEGFEHKLRDLQLDEISKYQGIALSQSEIAEIMLGMQVSDIEIKLLMLQGGM